MAEIKIHVILKGQKTSHKNSCSENLMSANKASSLTPDTPPNIGPLEPKKSNLLDTNPIGKLMENEIVKKLLHDPLATDIWRLYTKAQDQLPDGKRIENLIWRRMAIKLNRLKVEQKKTRRLSLPSYPSESCIQTSALSGINTDETKKGFYIDPNTISTSNRNIQTTKQPLTHNSKIRPTNYPHSVDNSRLNLSSSNNNSYEDLYYQNFISPAASDSNFNGGYFNPNQSTTNIPQGQEMYFNQYQNWNNPYNNNANLVAVQDDKNQVRYNTNYQRIGMQSGTYGSNNYYDTTQDQYNKPSNAMSQPQSMGGYIKPTMKRSRPEKSNYTATPVQSQVQQAQALRIIELENQIRLLLLDKETTKDRSNSVQYNIKNEMDAVEPKRYTSMSSVYPNKVNLNPNANIIGNMNINNSNYTNQNTKNSNQINTSSVTSVDHNTAHMSKFQVLPIEARFKDSNNEMSQDPSFSYEKTHNTCSSTSSQIGLICSNCHTVHTPLWRRSPQGLPLCNACGLFLKLHGKVRPLSMKTDVVRKRNRVPPTTIYDEFTHSDQYSFSLNQSQ